ncbi:hypothetical protein STRIP9103_09315, partial [Streptomyces ipomoeae 91-03]
LVGRAGAFRAAA